GSCQDAAQVAFGYEDRMRRLAISVQNAGNEAGPAQPASVGGAAPLALLHLQLDSFTRHDGAEWYLAPRTGGGSRRAQPRTAHFPSTLPMTLVMCATLCAGRSFCRTARSPPIISANLLASRVRPVSGATATSSSGSSRSRTYCASIGSAVMWSTGTSKKPCTCPAWRSIVNTRSA